MIIIVTITVIITDYANNFPPHRSLRTPTSVLTLPENAAYLGTLT